MPDLTETPDGSADLKRAAERFMATHQRRDGGFEHGGKSYWIKAVEDQRWINRLQKGPAIKAFETERAILKNLATFDLPVPPVLAQGDGYFIMPNCGANVESLIRSQRETVQSRSHVLHQAAVGLAQFHRAGFSHGRPILRDICWDGQKITFLDLENYRTARNTPDGHARDLLSFMFSCYAMRCQDLPEIEAAKAAYREQDTLGIWSLAAAMAPKYRWLDWLTRPAQWRKYPHAREFKAIPLTLRAFGV